MVQPNKYYMSCTVGVTSEVGLITNRDLLVMDICLFLPPDMIWHKVNVPKVDYGGGFVQRGPDEPNWTWTQIWVVARMSDYSLNWTRSSVIQGRQTSQWCRSPSRRWPSRSWGHFGLKSAIEHRRFAENTSTQNRALSVLIFDEPHTRRTSIEQGPF